MLECIGCEDDYVGLQNLVFLQKLLIFHCSKLRHIGSMDGLTSLTKFSMEYYNEIRNLPIGLGSCTSLDEMHVYRCGNLQEEGGLRDLKSLNCLKKLTMGEFYSELESFPFNFNTSLLPQASSIKTLDLCGWPKLKSLPHQFQHFTALQHLKISGFQGLEGLPDWFENFSSLQSLEIVYCPKLSHLGGLRGMKSLNCLEHLKMGSFYSELESFPFNLNTSLLQNSLKSLRLNGWPKLKSLPHQIQPLAALEDLTIFGFDGLETLPDWLGNLSSFKSLRIGDCKNLKYLPSFESMRRLTHLIVLQIYKCTLLEERCKKKSGPEWSKISHIPNIR